MKLLAIGTALLALHPASPPVQEDEPAIDPVALEIAVILLEAPGDAEDQQKSIAGFGTAAIAPAFDILATGKLRRVVDEGLIEEVPLSSDQDAIVLGALLRLRGSTVCDFLHWKEPEIDTDPERHTAVRLLRFVGKKRELALLVRLTNPDPEARRLELSRREPFANALREILTRDPLAARELVASYDAAHPALVAPIVRTVGRLESGNGLRLAMRLLGRIPEADPLILIEIARMGESIPHPLDQDVLDATRRYLRRSDPELLMLSADAAARLEDIEAVPRLIDLIDHPIRAVGNEALEALRVMTSLDYGRSSERWEEWYDKNLEWWRYEAPELLASISDGEPAEVSHALLELSKWRFYRHEIAREVAAALWRQEKDLVVLGCAVLGHLGSYSGVEPLVEVLGDQDPEVQEAALRALQRITGQQLADAKAWRELAAELQ